MVCFGFWVFGGFAFVAVIGFTLVGCGWFLVSEFGGFVWCCDTDSSCFAGWFAGFRVTWMVVSGLLVS